MASQLMKSVSGIRGIVGETVTPELVVSVGKAFAQFVKRGTVVVGRDSRASGDAIARNLESVLMLAGCDVISCGIVPTPTVQIMVTELNARGGIVVSASHNPIEWNAFKLISNRGIFLNSNEIIRFFSLMEPDFSYPRWNGIGNIFFSTDADTIHINKVLKVISTNKIKRRKYRVVLDSVNGAGSIITQKLLHRLGCEVIPHNCSITGTFPRGAEPLTKNLKGLADMVSKKSADIGFAQDPDADRLAIVDEYGVPIGEENTVALVVEHLLSKKPGRVVVNLSTTRTVEDIAKKYGVKFKRTKVGEIHVVEEMRKNGARIGGEGNGGVISPEIHLGRDSLAGIAYILEMMIERKKTISQLVSELPSYTMKKGKVKLAGAVNIERFYSNLKDMYKEERISSLDGIRIDFQDHKEFSGGWVHLRPSNTEPVFRIISEGKSASQANKIYRAFSKLLT